MLTSILYASEQKRAPIAPIFERWVQVAVNPFACAVFS